MSKGEVGKPAFYDFDDESDLKNLALAILKHWKSIAVVVAVVAGTVAVVNGFVLEPTYESSSVVVFSNAESVVDFGFDTFQTLASSPAVMSRIARDSRVPMSVVELTRLFTFKQTSGTPLLTASVRVGDPHLALQLVEAWIAAVQSETHRYMRDRLLDRKALAEANYLAQREALLATENALAQFDREHSLEVLEGELQRDIAQLVADEVRLENLRGSVIPADEATLQALSKLLAEEEAILDAGLLAAALPSGELQYSAVNPTYVEIRQRVTALESALAANRIRVEALEESLPQLRARVNEAHSLLTDLKIQRERLERDVDEALKLFEAARLERDRVLALERQLPRASRVDVVSEPIFSDRPVAPRTMLNLAIGVSLAVMMSVIGVLLFEWWRGDDGRAAVDRSC